MDRTDTALWNEVETAQERVVRSEVDESLILSNLELSAMERLLQHDRALKLALALRDADRVAAGSPRAAAPAR